MIFVANWKMNPLTYKEASALCLATRKIAKTHKKVKVAIAVPSIFARELAKSKNKDITIALQNVHEGDVGPFTGEISPVMARESGIHMSIVGHSERRAMGEDDERIAKKIVSCIEAGVVPIVCVGEKERDDSGKYLAQLEEQIKASLALVPKNKIKHLMIAYEPVWAIGKDDADAPSGNEIFEMVVLIRKVLSGMFDRETGDHVHILYGGSVSQWNLESIVKDGRVDGVLVGHMSLLTEELKQMIHVLASI